MFFRTQGVPCLLIVRLLLCVIAKKKPDRLRCKNKLILRARVCLFPFSANNNKAKFDFLLLQSSVLW